jgi:hypothetical protein
MSTSSRIPPPLAAGPFRLVTAAAAGVTRSQLLGAQYSRPFRGVHVVGQISALYDLCGAVRLVLPPDVAFSDETAAILLDLPLPHAVRRIHVTTAAGSSTVRRQGLVGHVRKLSASEVTMVGGLRVTTPARTFVDLAARLPRQVLVGMGDVILCNRLSTTADLAAAVGAAAGRRGARRARELLPLLDERSESPMESAVRLLLLDAGLPRPEVNANVYDRNGNFLARADLLFRAARVIVEYDGDHHRTDRQQFAHDVRRLSQLSAAGYIVLRFTASDVFLRPDYVVATVRSALATASRQLGVTSAPQTRA